jgi:hypothetical protein
MSQDWAITANYNGWDELGLELLKHFIKHAEGKVLEVDAWTNVHSRERPRRARALRRLSFVMSQSAEADSSHSKNVVPKKLIYGVLLS